MEAENPLIEKRRKEKSASCAGALACARSGIRPVDELKYRGFDVEFFDDPIGSQVWCEWKGERVEFGADNTQYREDMSRLIDDELDTVCRWEEFPGAKLTWFLNGGSRDLKLVDWGRILKVYPIGDPREVSLTACVGECARILSEIEAKEEGRGVSQASNTGESAL